MTTTVAINERLAEVDERLRALYPAPDGMTEAARDIAANKLRATRRLLRERRAQGIQGAPRDAAELDMGDKVSD